MEARRAVRGGSQLEGLCIQARLAQCGTVQCEPARAWESRQQRTMLSWPASLQAPMSRLKVDVLGLRPPPAARMLANTCSAPCQSPCGRARSDAQFS